MIGAIFFHQNNYKTCHRVYQYGPSHQVENQYQTNLERYHRCRLNSEKLFREHLLEVFRIQNLMSLFWTRNSVLTRNFWNLGPSDLAQFSRIFWKLRRIDVEILTKRLNILQRTRKLKERSLFPLLRKPQIHLMKF